MPYISDYRRFDLWHSLEPVTAGELNWLVTKFLIGYLSRKGESYQTYCEIEGVLSHASKELYRRKVSTYEDKKIKENGDVY